VIEEGDIVKRSADDRYILYTGGTTGMPKGVVWRHEDVLMTLGGGIDILTGNRAQRPEDIVPLARHFLKTTAARYRKDVRTLAPEALELLLGAPWPGNVRQLANVVEQAVVLCRGESIDVEDLPEEITGDRGPQDVLRIPVGNTLADAERELILETLRKAGGNKTQAAKMLGIGVRTLYRKLEEYGQT